MRALALLLVTSVVAGCSARDDAGSTSMVRLDDGRVFAMLRPAHILAEVGARRDVILPFEGEERWVTLQHKEVFSPGCRFDAANGTSEPCGSSPTYEGSYVEDAKVKVTVAINESEVK